MHGQGDGRTELEGDSATSPELDVEGLPQAPPGGAKSSLGVRGWDCLGRSWRTGCVTHITAGGPDTTAFALIGPVPLCLRPSAFLLCSSLRQEWVLQPIFPRKASDSGRCPHWGSPGAESRR